jgi:hypothetical protein
MNRMEIAAPMASWSDIFSAKAKIRQRLDIPRSAKLRKDPAEMHLPYPSFLSKEWGEVQPGSSKSPRLKSPKHEPGGNFSMTGKG